MLNGQPFLFYIGTLVGSIFLLLVFVIKSFSTNYKSLFCRYHPSSSFLYKAILTFGKLFYVKNERGKRIFHNFQVEKKNLLCLTLNKNCNNDVFGKTCCYSIRYCSILTNLP
jgi:hypothetical protein